MPGLDQVRFIKTRIAKTTTANKSTISIMFAKLIYYFSRNGAISRNGAFTLGSADRGSLRPSCIDEFMRLALAYPGSQLSRRCNAFVKSYQLSLCIHMRNLFTVQAKFLPVVVAEIIVEGCSI